MARIIEAPIYKQATLSSTHGFFPSSFLSRILVAIPCYNEEITIGSIVLKAKQFNEDILVINDGSQDATATIAEEAGAMVVSHPENLGKAASIMNAVQFARVRDYDILVLLDGDGQHNVDDIPIILQPILNNRADLVIGSRFLSQMSGTNNVPRYRRLGQKTLDLVSNASSTYKSTDSQSGFRALSRRALVRLNLASEGYNIESDMIRHLAEEGLTITEVPISARYDTPNNHKKDAFSHGFDILSHIIGLISYRRPMLAFGVPGLAITILGFSLGIYVLTIYFTTGAFHYILFLGVIVALILGLLLITAGFIMNSIAQVIKFEKIK